MVVIYMVHIHLYGVYRHKWAPVTD